MSNQNESGYDRWSTFYDSYSNPTVAIDDASFPSVYKDVRGKKVLEIGCGTGRHTLRLLAQGNDVTGIDLSEGMLHQLRQKIQEPSLILRKGDFLKLPIDGGTFDVLLESLVLEHIFDLEAFFQKAAQVLKPNGIVYLSEIHPDRTAAGIFAHFKNSDGTETQLQSAAHQSDDIAAAAEKASFEILRLQTIHGTDALAALQTKWKKHLGQPMTQIWELRLRI